MDTHFLDESVTWKLTKEKRTKSFVYISAIIFVFTASSWILITALAGAYILTGIIIVVELFGLLSLQYLRLNKVSQAGNILIFTSSAYFLTLCLITVGSDNNTTHLWFIVMALFTYFLLADSKTLIKEILPITFLLLMFGFHFKIIPGFDIIKMPEAQQKIISMIDAFFSLTVIFILTRLFALEITKAESILITYSDKLDSLIENILPKTIADRLKKEGKTFADHYPECSVMFADIVGFTPWAEKRTPTEVVDQLNMIFSRLDEIADKLNLTKIKTMGDSYMVASGIPIYKEDHASSLVQFAKEIHDYAATFTDLQFRVGIHSGPVVAGVIGKKRIIYDLWGDTVNVASRLEFHCHVGKTLISDTTKNLLSNKFPVASQHVLELKGKGRFIAHSIDFAQSQYSLE